MNLLVHASRELAHPYAGGSEVYIDQVLRGLHQQGHNVHLATARPVGTRPYETSGNGGTFSQFFRAPLWLLTKRRRYDVVVDVANGMTFYSPLFRRRPTICLVHHIHTRMWSEWFPAPVAAFGRFLERRAMPLIYRNSLFVAVSESTSRELQALGVKADNIRIVHNSTRIPATPVAEKDQEPLFVACGRLVPHKQFHLLLEHWPAVRAATGGRLVIIGEGPEDERLQALLTEGASLAGRVSEDERDQLFARATALLHPSYVEGWGLVIMEAAAQGTPALGFDVPGVRDSIVDGETGWVCHDVDHLVKTWTMVAQAATNKADGPDDELASMSAAARQRAHEFGVDRLVKAFTAVLEEAASKVPVAAVEPTAPTV